MLEETPSAEKSGIAEASPRQVLDALAFAEKAARDLVRSGSATLRPRLMRDGKVIQELIDANQHATHALAWIATYAEALGQMRGWGMRLAEDGRMGEVETLILLVGAGEYLAQLTGGIPMSQGEMARPRDLGLEEHALAAFRNEAVRGLISDGSSPEIRARLAALLPQRQGYPTVGATGLDDELEMIRGQFRRFTDERVSPYAQQWHRDNALIPMAVISEMAEMGVFGLTIPEQFGGLGMSKAAMCVVSEELSRGYIGVGSLGTRSEIAAELILCGGTEEQKNRWLPLIASGEVLPTAVFTEPNVGSDLGSLRTRAHKKGDAWLVTGSKTWITHAARANLMTLLARTDPNSQDYRGLSMFLAEKHPGTEDEPFPQKGLDGSEIEVLGYRGMREYELGFDGYEVGQDGLLGGEVGQGFKQLMQTFESARIQTAARAIGVAQNALELGLRYAEERRQFGQALISFPRVANKLAMMAAEIMISRQLTYHAAREKDSGRRSDLQAGMAKLLASRVAWAAADNALQIHGGNGFALEYEISRVLCDARILSIFEGAAEIQAQVIARRLLA